ncbi:hypothetical protein G9F73_013935 [Clostridium estertheticum]|uniref:hypothetical protein n=1 Tax=Clostridium estertheticum TaxID=238834 RepID=UPI0013EECA81|nr:hypothetical protein [Clostridium estertheticum]MBZ9608900.1 hypothetical protein [Clostridium estertheticum]
MKLFSLLFLITIAFTGCKSSDENNAQKVAQEFGRNLYTVNTEKVAEYKKLLREGKKIDIASGNPTNTGGVIPHTQEYIKIIQSLDKNLLPLMTAKGYETIAGHYNIVATKFCNDNNYTLQVTDFILDKNLYGEKEDKAGYYYEAKLKFISTNGKAERTDTAKGYIGLLKENGKWKVFVYKSEADPKLYIELMKKIKE